LKVLIAGGAGFIGSTIASACLDAAIKPVILDNLVTGRREFITGRDFYEGDIADGQLVDCIFKDHPDVDAVIHCAALIVVPESVADPVTYYRANVVKSLEFVDHLVRNGCERLIFSSSAAIYGAGADLTVDENSPINPQSPYARTKAVCEAMFADIAAAQTIRVLSLRYFNPIGADPKMRTGLQLSRPTHALGKMMQALEDGVPFQVTGTDYPTRDGSGIRDYIHVWDLAAAHVAALSAFDALLAPMSTSLAINLGTGTGTTVREFLDAFNEVASVPIRAQDAERRPGDVAGAYTRIDRAVRLLDWQPQYGIADGIRHSLQWAALRHEVLSDEAADAALRRGPLGPAGHSAAVLLPHFPGQISDRSRCESGQYHGESHECTHITSETMAQVSQQGGGKDRGDISSFTLESGRRAGQLYDAGFRDPLMPASAQKVPQFKALLPHMVVDHGARHVEDNRRRLGRCEPDGQFSLLTPGGPRTHSADHAVKSAYLEGQGGLQAHAGPDRVSHRIRRNR
jgi:UDP-glucose 4-epimerase